MSNCWEKLPEAFINKIRELYVNHTDAVLQSFCSIKPTTFRINSLKTKGEVLEEALQKEHIPFQRLSWYANAYVLVDVPKSALIETNAYKNGSLYIQSLSSMIPALVLDPQRDERILDLCAAPGSKTTQMAAMMHNTGELIANDTSRSRLYKLVANLQNAGVTNTKTEHIRGERLWQKYPEYFDKALVDVPCSMEGRFVADDPKTFKDWSPRKAKLLSQQQQYLLRSAISATKVGGSVVYSTCTISVEENEAVIDWILKKEGDAIALEEISIDGFSFAPAFMTWKKKIFSPEIAKTKRITPSESMEGFFIAKLRKRKSTLRVTISPHGRS
jgi:16S rRNA (cytosine1407-C5)-methyltransferase